jgi:DNA-binding HxlR family transcriptional regulator
VHTCEHGRVAADDLTALDAAVARVGDRWTLLLVAALLEGPRRFGELQDALPTLAPNVLTRRLRHLEAEGLVVGAPYSRRPVRVAYRLTEDGNSLAGALRLLAQWGSEHAHVTGTPGGARDDAVPLHHATCGTPVEARWWCPTCARLVDPPDELSEVRWA